MPGGNRALWLTGKQFPYNLGGPRDWALGATGQPLGCPSSWGALGPLGRLAWEFQENGSPKQENDV